MKDEVWKDCKHYEGLYQVSNYGRVKSLDRDVLDKKGSTKHIYEKYLTQHDNGHGYLTVQMWKHNAGKREYVHRLVALAFIPNPDKKTTVNHIDEDKQNNYVGNLEWMTHQENNNYGSHNQNIYKTNLKNGAYEQARKRWINNNPSKENPKMRGNNGYARKVICGGIVFDCIKDCAEYYDASYSNMRKYLSKSNALQIPERFITLGLKYA